MNFSLVHGSTTLSQIAFYGLGLNSGIILQTIGFGGPFSKTPNTLAVYQNLRAIAVGNLILSAADWIPGYYASFFLIDSWARKPIQLMGSTMLTILFIILGMFFFYLCFHLLNIFIQVSDSTDLLPLPPTRRPLCSSIVLPNQISFHC